MHTSTATTGARTRRTPGTLSPAAFTLIGRIHALTDGQRVASPGLREAVAVLTAAAEPDRAERLHPRSGEPPALVARLAVWAARRVDDTTVLRASAILDQSRDTALTELLEGRTARC
ncbi:hypothetical protein [Euzebya tangerina]|uniref:hypothetical protein n=1 Tax=Euzebya tangerina TaxID=591198 RepID=UPI0013C2B14E|nr:hypothetical protein [Euzebya tangerina]